MPKKGYKKVPKSHTKSLKKMFKSPSEVAKQKRKKKGKVSYGKIKRM